LRLFRVVRIRVVTSVRHAWDFKDPSRCLSLAEC
jgi:hypothetical protein